MNTQMNLQRIPVEKLKPAKYNPRKDLKPGDPAYEKIRRSLQDFGYVDPVIWNEAMGNIIGGHQRYKVLVAEGVTEIDCVVVHIENPSDEKALNIALNKATGDWEPTALADLLSDLQLNGYDLGATGFDAAEIDELFTKVHDKEVKVDSFDVTAALEKAAFVQPGDVWLLGEHRLVCGDSTKPDDVESS
ncbi:ParB N-terminal domain-containing protein [Eubacteriales bacterium OttesenSCG-928-A19]|nr:ParB N-terminal domain-containing protein [Eubacteriales bacterium OttesenSCG-928-A19]